MTSDWAYPDRTGESVESSGAEIISLDQVVEEEDTLAVDQDGVDSMRDIEAEANDEQGLRDMSIVDRDEADDLGVRLDRTGQREPELD
jgi:hypothetical protein